jgi:DNA-directed RNA polymerase specialized sigma subunit
MTEEVIQERRKKAQEWLQRYGDAKCEVRRNEEEMAELVETQDDSRAAHFSKFPKRKGSLSDLSDYMIEREKARKNIRDAMQQNILVFEEVWNAINELDNAKEKEVLSYRYIRGMNWEQICDKIGKSWSHTHRIHNKALDHIAELDTLNI